MFRCFPAFCPRHRAVLAASLMSGLLSPAMAHVSVSVWPARPEIKDNQTIRFRAEVAGADPATPCRWILRRPGQPVGGPELGSLADLGPGRVEYTPPRVAATDYFILQAVPIGCAEPRHSDTAVIEVSPARPHRREPALPPDLMRLVASYAPGEVGSVTPVDSALPGDVLERVFEYAPEEGSLLGDPQAPWIHISEFGTAGMPRYLRIKAAPDKDVPLIRHLGRYAQVKDWDLVVGFDRPLRLQWEPTPGATGCWLSHAAHANGSGCRNLAWDVRGLGGKEIRIRDGAETVWVQSVRPDPQRQGHWLCDLQALTLMVRGMTSVAGNPDGDSGHQDGRGLEARFDAPFGIALLRECPYEPWGHAKFNLKCVVTDPGRNTVRAVYDDGDTRTLWGQDRVAGYREGRLGEALFNHPTYVAPFRDGSECLLSDSRNNLIRRIDRDGVVSTFAGRQGDHPFANGPRLDATFRDPRGLAASPDGTVFVADRGHGLIRRILPSGEVETVAGVPESFGAEDGPLGTGRFTDLRGIALGHSAGVLYILDGRALRRLTLADGNLATLRGSVAGEGRFGAPGQKPLDPCFSNPVGLALDNGRLYLTDRDQHILVQFSPPDFQGRILAGDPDYPVSAPGLLRDGLALFPGDGYASLRFPACVGTTLDDSWHAGLWVASDRWISRVQGPLGRPSGPVEPELKFHPVQDGQSCALTFQVPHTPVAGEIPLDSDLPLPPDFEYTVTCFDGEGHAIGQPIPGSGHYARPLRVPELPIPYRDGRVRVRYVTTTGFSAATEQAVRLERKDATDSHL